MEWQMTKPEWRIKPEIRMTKGSSPIAPTATADPARFGHCCLPFVV